MRSRLGRSLLTFILSRSGADGRVRGPRLVIACLVAAALLWAGAAPAGDPEVPEKYVSVAEVKALQDLKKRVTFIDVRPSEQFDELHIAGARNIPLRELQGRLPAVSRQDFVVLY